MANWGYSNKFITDLAVSSMCLAIKKLKYLRSIDLNLDSWGSSNNQITDQSLKLLTKIFTQHIFKVSIDLSKWLINNTQISYNGLHSFFQSIRRAENLKKLTLNMSDWSFALSSQQDRLLSFSMLCQSIEYLSQLCVLKIDFSKWLSTFAKDKHIQFLFQQIGKILSLQELSINLNYWGDQNTDITISSLQHIFQNCALCPYLTTLEVALSNWSLQPKRSTFKSTPTLEKSQTVENDANIINSVVYAIQKMKHLQTMDLNLIAWPQIGIALNDKI